MNPYRQILDRDVLVQRFLVVGIADDVLLHRPRMHHGFAKDHSAEKTASALVMNDTCMVSG